VSQVLIELVEPWQRGSALSLLFSLHYVFLLPSLAILYPVSIVSTQQPLTSFM
jgi:hypothetical protein